MALARRPANYVLSARRVATPVEIVQDGFVVVEGGSVRQVGRGSRPYAATTVHLGDLMIAPGFIDVHVHGGGGAQVNCATREEVEASVRRMAQFHAGHGTTSLVATTVSDSPESLRVAVEGVAAVTRGSATTPLPGAVILGSNLEGPWIARSRAGAQFPGAIRPPSIDEFDDLVKRAEGTLRIVTLAPELEGALDLIAAVRSAGVVASIGHTDADHATAKAAFDAGARLATHLFNAMAPIHHRRPGPVAAALADDRVSLEIIADGVHIHPALISLVADVAPERVVLMTDAIGATGTVPGRHRLGPLEVQVANGRAVLVGHEETVAGSVLTMERALSLAVRVAAVPLLVALQATSLHPAQVLGEQHKGRLAPGADADMVVLDDDLALVATIVGGRVVHDPGRLFGAVEPLSLHGEALSQAPLP
jgi:N-acetylglucosamine-6-phosphate deacetylase